MGQYQEFQKRFFSSNMSKGAKPINIKLTKKEKKFLNLLLKI